MMKNLFAKAHATLKAHNTDAAALLGGVKPSNQVSEQEKKNFAEKVKAFQASQTAAGTTSTAAAADPFAAFELQNQDGANANGEINSGKEGEVAIDSALNIRTNDIQNDPSVSIFEMLTARYLKSYPVLFDEEKAAPSK